MKTKETYPTWIRIQNDEIISEEQRNGVPDFRIVRDAPSKQWCVKWRTSAHWSGQTFETAAAAMRSIEEQMKRQESNPWG